MIESQKSSDKMRAAKIADAPFGRDAEGLLIVDSEKLAKLWASNTEALLAVGEGFENVVKATNAMIRDNEKTRLSNASAGRAALIATGFNLFLVASVVTLFALKHW